MMTVKELVKEQVIEILTRKSLLPGLNYSKALDLIKKKENDGIISMGYGVELSALVFRFIEW